MPGLWKDENGEREDKYLVLRRDGTAVEWPSFTLAAADPAAPAALVAYAHKAAELGMDHDYVDDVLELSQEFECWLRDNGEGDPGAPRHRHDDPAIIAKMKENT